MAKIEDRAIFLSANALNKTLEQAIIDGDLSGSGSTPDATTSLKGKLKLAGDLGGTADLPTVPDLANKAPLASPSLTGTPTTPDIAPLDSSSQIANTKYVDDAVSVAVSGGSSPMEVFNHTVKVNGSAYSTVTGLNYFTSPSAKTISHVKLRIWTKNAVVTGSMTIDIKKNTTPDDVCMTSIFSSLPTINFATAVDFDSNGGTVSGGSISIGDVLRLDITSIPSGWVGTISILVYA
jgi:hypothetical protein